MSTEPQRPSSERLMAEEVRDATDSGEPRLAKPIGERSNSYWSTLWSSRLLIGITLAMVLVIAGIVALALGTWWILLVALLVHFVATMIVVAFVFQLSTQVEQPAPETVAALEERGVRDPERELNEQVAATEDEHEDAERQQRTVTPSHESREVR